MDFGLQPGEGGHIGMDPGGNNSDTPIDPFTLDQPYYAGDEFMPYDLASMYSQGSTSTGVYGNPSAPNTTPFASGLANINDFFNKNAFGKIAGMALNFTPAGKAFNVGRGVLTALGSGNTMGAVAGLGGAYGGVPGAIANAGYQASRGNVAPGVGLATGLATGNPLASFGASTLAGQFQGRGGTPGINGNVPNQGGENGFNVGALAEGLLGLYGNRGGGNIDGAAADNQAVSQQIQSLGNMYSPNSPYAQQLRQTLERKDAAAGRRSQYGPREVQLMAALADKQASVSDSMGRLAQTNQANQIALQDRKRLQRGQNLATLGKMIQSSGLANMFRSSPAPVAAPVDETQFNFPSSVNWESY